MHNLNMHTVKWHAYHDLLTNSRKKLKSYHIMQKVIGAALKLMKPQLWPLTPKFLNCRWKITNSFLVLLDCVFICSGHLHSLIFFFTQMWLAESVSILNHSSWTNPDPVSLSLTTAKLWWWTVHEKQNIQTKTKKHSNLTVWFCWCGNSHVMLECTPFTFSTLCPHSWNISIPVIAVGKETFLNNECICCLTCIW